MVEQCPLAKLFRDPRDLKDMPETCWEQCHAVWEAAISASEFDIEEVEDVGADGNASCSHHEVESGGERITKVGESALRDLLLFEDCTNCGEHVQSTIYRFLCPYEKI